jgi:hypothetical protein
MSETVTEVDGILNSDVLTKCTIFLVLTLISIQILSVMTTNTHFPDSEATSLSTLGCVLSREATNTNCIVFGLTG